MKKSKNYIFEKKTNPHATAEPSDKSSPDYKVGYGKPPKHTQFKKGQSGNAKGRPKGAKNIETIVKQELNDKVKVTLGGKTKKLTKLEIAMKQIADKAAKGDPKALAMMFSLAKEYCAPTTFSSALTAWPTADELAILEDVVEFNLMIKNLKDE